MPITRSALAELYDRFLDHSAHYITENADSGFLNLGYFTGTSMSLSEACARLTEEVVATAQDRQGPVLDVGCGAGGGTACIARHWPADRVHGANISDHQLDACRRRVPGAHFHLMPAEDLAFPDATFRTVISIEAACHFDRPRFLAEAMRILRPGGELVVADILFHDQPEVFGRFLSDQEIYRDIGSYEAMWRSAGFDDIACRDVTAPVWQGFVRNRRARALQGLMTKTLEPAAFRKALAFADKIAALPVSAYVIARATKPAAMS